MDFDSSQIRMKHLFSFLLCAVGTQSLCFADVTKLSADDRKVLQDSARFHEVHSSGDLSPAIVALCGDKLAEPGQNWNATDAITDPTLPAKRLIWATIDGDYYVVHCERGGIAHTFYLLVAKLRKGEPKPKLVWRAVG